MKTLLAALFLVLGTSIPVWAGGEAIRETKDAKQMAAPLAPQWYADREWNVGVWGTYVFTENRGQEPATAQGVPWNSDRYLGTDDAFGGGIDLKYFFHRYFGIGIEGYGLAVHREAQEQRIARGQQGNPFNSVAVDKAVGSVLGTFTLRYPIGRFAPYVFAGGGVIFGGGEVEHFELNGAEGEGVPYAEVYRGGDSTAAIGQFGGGLEVRITPHIGLLSDFSWNVVDGPINNFGMVRAGVNFAF